MRLQLLVPALALVTACNGGKDGPADRPTITARTMPADLASGAEHTCLLVDGEARCWGHNGLGEAVSNDGPFARISVGSQFNCGLDDAGAATCWGVSGDERLLVPSGVTFSELDVGTAHGCGLDTEGTIRCWGRGAGTDVRPPDTGTFLDLDSGNDVTCAVDTTGLPVCFGTSDGIKDPPDGAYDVIRVGTTEACALTPDGELACWGGGAVSFDAPSSGAFADVAVGDSVACALSDDDGSVSCWGGAGPGFGSEIVSGVPTGSFTQVSVGTGHACALGDAGPVCWGADSYGAASVPTGGFTGVVAATSAACGVNDDSSVSCFGLHGAFATLNGHKWRSIELHSADACAVSDAGAATCGLGNVRTFEFDGTLWADAVDYGNVGFCGLTTSGVVACFARNKTELPGLEGTYQDIATGHDGICGLSTDGAISCIGDADLTKPAGTFASLAMGGFACALDADGAIACWGADAPATGQPDGTFSQVTVGGTFACALTQGDGELICWGDDGLVVPQGHYATSIDADGGTVCGGNVLGEIECFGDMTRVSLK